MTIIRTNNDLGTPLLIGLDNTNTSVSLTITSKIVTEETGLDN